MKHRLRKTFQWFFAALALLFCGLGIIPGWLYRYTGGSILFLFGIRGDRLTTICFMFFIFFFFISLMIFAWNSSVTTTLIILGIFISSVLFIVIIIREPEYLFLSSPDGKYTLVVEQQNSGQGNFYQKVSEHFYREIGTFSSNRNTRPFGKKNGQQYYRIEWTEDGCIVYYKNFFYGNPDWAQKKLKFVDNTKG